MFPSSTSPSQFSDKDFQEQLDKAQGYIGKGVFVEATKIYVKLLGVSKDEGMYDRIYRVELAFAEVWPLMGLNSPAIEAYMRAHEAFKTMCKANGEHAKQMHSHLLRIHKGVSSLLQLVPTEKNKRYEKRLKINVITSHLNRGDSFQNQGDTSHTKHANSSYKEAVQEYGLAVNLIESFTHSELSLDETTLYATTYNNMASTLLAQANIAKNLQQLDIAKTLGRQAAHLCNKALVLISDSFFALYNLGRAQFLQGEYKLALTNFKLVASQLESAPNFAQYKERIHKYIAACYHNLDSTNKANNALLGANISNSNTVISVPPHQEVKEFSRELVSKYISEAIAFHKDGSAFELNKKESLAFDAYEKGAQCYQSSIDLFNVLQSITPKQKSELAKLYRNLALSLLRLRGMSKDNYQRTVLSIKCVDSCKEAIAQSDDSCAPYFILGQVYAANKQHQEAIGYFKKAQDDRFKPTDLSEKHAADITRALQMSSLALEQSVNQTFHTTLNNNNNNNNAMPNSVGNFQKQPKIREQNKKPGKEEVGEVTQQLKGVNISDEEWHATKPPVLTNSEIDAQLDKAALHVTKNEMPQAIEIYKKMTQHCHETKRDNCAFGISLKLGDLYRQQGHDVFARGAYVAAYDYFIDVAKVNPNEAKKLHVFLPSLLQDYQAVAPMNPENNDYSNTIRITWGVLAGYNTLAHTLQQKGDACRNVDKASALLKYAEAIETYRLAITTGISIFKLQGEQPKQLPSTMSGVYNNFAFICIEQAKLTNDAGEREKLLNEACEKALMAQDDNKMPSFPLYNLGRAYYLLGNYRKAEAALLEALAVEGLLSKTGLESHIADIYDSLEAVRIVLLLPNHSNTADAHNKAKEWREKSTQKPLAPIPAKEGVSNNNNNNDVTSGTSSMQKAPVGSSAFFPQLANSSSVPMDVTTILQEQVSVEDGIDSPKDATPDGGGRDPMAITTLLNTPPPSPK